MSMFARWRASRRVAPICGIGGNVTKSRSNVLLRREGVFGVGVLEDRGGRRRGWATPLGQRCEYAREVGFGHEHLARLGPLVAGDDASALEHVDQAPGARVAQAQAAL